MKNDLNSYDDSSSSSENSKAACLTVDKFDDEFRKTACYTTENENETAYQVMKMNLCWVIDLSATAHCTDDWSIFENLTF